MNRRGDWQPIRGDGSDKLPVGTSYDARVRNGMIFDRCCITTFCLKFGRDLFRHSGRQWDVMEIRILGERA